MPASAFDELTGLLEHVLSGELRPDCVNRLVRSSRTLGDALSELRTSMRTHAWVGAGQRATLVKAVQVCDARTRAEGFHALHDWDGIADHVNAEMIPVDVLDFVRRVKGDDQPDPQVLSILVDYYFFHVLSLLALRAWDTPDPDAALGKVGQVLDLLQGPHGSGQPFVSDPETLLLIATSHYEPDERGYESLLGQVRSLSPARRLVVALGHAGCLGAHLRFGFMATYARKTDAMRADNIADYPWLQFAAAEVLRAFEKQPSPPLAAALFNSLTADTSFLLADTPFRECLAAQAVNLRPLFADCEPRASEFSPVSFFFNFSYNVLKGTVSDALLRGDAWTVSFNDLLMGPGAGHGALASRTALATTLMGHARRHPQRIRGQLMPVIVYDPASGRAAHQTTMVQLRAAVAL